MNGAKHRFSLILTCLLLTGLTVVYPFLLYTDNAFVTKWREWYIETAMGTMTHQWLATSFIPHDMIEKVMTKRYLMNQKQAGAESFWDFTLDTDGEEQGHQSEGQILQAVQRAGRDRVRELPRQKSGHQGTGLRGL